MNHSEASQNTSASVNQFYSLSIFLNSSNRFLRNKAAVAGVFILVGLAAASIILWIFFAIRRRRHTQLLEHESAVAATLAAAGFNRSPLEDEDDHAIESGHSRDGSNDPFLHHRSSSPGFGNVGMSSIPSADRTSTALDYDPYNPYTDYVFPAKFNRVPSPPFIYRPYRPRSTSDSMGEKNSGHTPQHSGGSHEPLLATYNRASRPSSSGTLPPQRLSDTAIDLLAVPDRPSSPSSAYSGDHRLDPLLRKRFQGDADSSRDLRDEEDYSRPVLGV